MAFENKFLLGRIKEVIGTSTLPISSDNRIVVTFCTADGTFEALPNNKAIAKVWPKAKEVYRAWWRAQKDFKGGQMKVDAVSSATEIATLLTLVVQDEQPAFEANFTKEAIDSLGKYASLNKRNVHVDKVGTKEEWAVIFGYLQEFVAKRGINLFVYSA